LPRAVSPGAKIASTRLLMLLPMIVPSAPVAVPAASTSAWPPWVPISLNAAIAFGPSFSTRVSRPRAPSSEPNPPAAVSSGPQSAPSPRSVAPHSLSFLRACAPKPWSSASAARPVAPAASFMSILKSLSVFPASAFASLGPAFWPNRSAAFCARRNGSAVLLMSSIRRCSSSGDFTLPSALLSPAIASAVLSPDALARSRRPTASCQVPFIARRVGASCARAAWSSRPSRRTSGGSGPACP
jgi:hypothetical protein